MKKFAILASSIPLAHFSMSSTTSTITRGIIAATMLLTVTSRIRSMLKS